MTTEPEPTEPLEERNDEPLDEVEAATEPSDATEDTEPVEQGKGNREARYRRQLRDTEAERDTLRGQIAAMQRGEAERLAGTQLSKPAALWAAGTELTALLDDKGNVDPAKVAAAAETAATALGAAAPRRRPLPDRAQGASGGTSRANPWKEAFERDKA